MLKNKNHQFSNKFNLFGLIICIIIILFILISKSSLFFNKNNINNSTLNNSSPTDEISSTENKITINAVGDVMAHESQLKAQYNKSTDTYSFDNNYKFVSKYMEKADLSIVNLETTFAGNSVPYSSYPAFNTPDTLADALKNAGVDVVSTINNHTFDKGDLGFERTLEVLKERNFDTVGTVLDNNDKNYLIKNINNINLGIISFSYGELRNNSKYLNGIKLSDKSKDKANIFDVNNTENAFNIISEKLNYIKETDIQVLIIHWGNEYQRVPNKFQSELAQMLCDNGVDIIIGSHPHVVQTVEMLTPSDKSQISNNQLSSNTDITNKNPKQTLVIYSLGNFISNQREEILGTPYTEDGLMVDIEITKNDTETYVSNVICTPTWVNKFTDTKVNYEIIPITTNEDFSNLNISTLNKLKKSYTNTASQIKQSNIINVVKNPFE